MKNSIFCILFLLFTWSKASQGQWVKQSSGTSVSLWDIKFVTPDIGFSTGWDNTTSTFLKTSNGGATWKKTDMSNSYMFSTCFLDSMNGFLAGYDFGCSCGYIRKTNNGGASWTDTKVPETFGFYNVIMKDANNGWASGYSGKILLTKDGWATHDSGITGTGSVVFRELFEANEDTLYAGGGPDFQTQNLVYRSTDGGKNWKLIKDFSGKFSIAGMYFANGKTGFLVGNDGTDAILKTTDGGATWISKFSGSNSSDLVYAIHFRGSTGYAVSAFGKIYKTTDQGEHWTSETSPTANGLYSLYMVNDFTGYAAGVNGTIIKRSVNTGLADKDNLTGISLDVYPNPSTGATYIRVILKETGFAGLKLHDINGKLIRDFGEKKFPAGEINFTINKNELTPGIYFLHLEGANDTVVKQVIIE
jgi:photosystem II stability/assembly factor-like uncharacterized protein